MTLDCCQSNQAGITRRDFAAVFREVTQRSRDIPKYGCEGGYPYLGTFVYWYSTPQREKNQLSTATLQQNLKFGINIMVFFSVWRQPSRPPFDLNNLVINVLRNLFTAQKSKRSHTIYSWNTWKGFIDAFRNCLFSF